VSELAYRLTRLLEILCDGDWHEMDQLPKLMGLSDFEMRRIVDFLGRYDIAEVDETRRRIRVSRDFKRILTQRESSCSFRETGDLAQNFSTL
jgi:hypothetical protein